MSQEDFDKKVEQLISINDSKELWCFTVTTQGLNYNRVIEYYINAKDSFYLEELVSAMSDELDQEYLVDKMIGTKDKNFIKEALLYCNKSMQYSMNQKLLEKLLDYVK